MKPNISKLNQTEQEQITAQQRLQASSTAREFASVDEMLRFDASQVAPPDTLETRLQNSLQQTPAPRQPWWRRWFGK
jgi:hypothetical protein